MLPANVHLGKAARADDRKRRSGWLTTAAKAKTTMRARTALIDDGALSLTLQFNLAKFNVQIKLY
jgi:hypothetical protein